MDNFPRRIKFYKYFPPSPTNTMPVWNGRGNYPKVSCRQTKPTTLALQRWRVLDLSEKPPFQISSLWVTFPFHISDHLLSTYCARMLCYPWGPQWWGGQSLSRLRGGEAGSWGCPRAIRATWRCVQTIWGAQGKPPSPRGVGAGQGLPPRWNAVEISSFLEFLRKASVHAALGEV